MESGISESIFYLLLRVYGDLVFVNEYIMNAFTFYGNTFQFVFMFKFLRYLFLYFFEDDFKFFSQFLQP